MDEKIIKRFWSKVEVSDGCWLWLDALVGIGYGRFYIDEARPYCRAHRFSWELEHGPIPDGLSCLHDCDTPACVRPSHLFLGTTADNVADRVAKGRSATGLRHGRHTRPDRTARGDRNISRKNPSLRRGARNGNAAVDEAQVKEIRRRAATGEARKVLSIEFDISRSQINRIVSGYAWRHSL